MQESYLAWKITSRNVILISDTINAYISLTYPATYNDITTYLLDIRMIIDNLKGQCNLNVLHGKGCM